VKEPIWLRKDLVLAVHERLLAEHGGSSGIRDEGLLDSALGRAQNLFAYGNETIFELGSAYACGIIKNHPFIDGNKRTGFMAAYLFLARNGYELTAAESDVVLKTLSVAEGTMTDEEYAAWLKANSSLAKTAKQGGSASGKKRA
jgi:death-on-curing protein